MPKSQLVELYAYALGIIDEARLECGPGFNVLTGETGAGKTLLIGALELCLGDDGSISRHALTTDTRAAAVFARGDGTEVVLSREAGPTGRLRSSLDGVSSSAAALRALAGELIVIHGQHDSLALRHRSEVLRIIDARGAVSTKELDATRVASHEARRMRDSLGGDAGERERELDYVIFQIGEFEAVAIDGPDELDRTLEELTRLTGLRESQTTLVELVDRLDADSDVAVLSLLARAIGRVPPGHAYEAARKLLLGALEQAREGVHELSSLTDPDAFDASALKDLEDRATILQQVARKYGGSLETAISTLARLRDQREAQFDASARLATLDLEIVELADREGRLAHEARRERLAAAKAMTTAVAAQLPRVALPHATLRFDVDGDDGSLAQILFAPNPGLPEGPLQALASGGELSRVLLALSLESVHEDVVAVFDEVDGGVGGQVAQQIGECLAELGRRQQVLAVTHLASVAARADSHFVIEKSVTKGVSSTSLRVVDGDDRVAEIARMLAGDEITSESRALARRMLETNN